MQASKMDCDVVVIGSGAGGLAAALPLAQAGKSVIVVEQHNVPGGLCHSFKHDGHRYSPGVHYIGQLGHGESMREVYEGLGIAKYMRFHEMNPKAYEHFNVAGTCVDVPAGKAAVIQSFQAAFPKESKNIALYFELLDTINRQIQTLQVISSVKDVLLLPWRIRHLIRYGLFSLERRLNSLFEDTTLKTLLAMQCGDHGLPPSKAPFAMHAAVAGHYLTGAYYPEGGGRSLPRAFVKGLQAAGGQLMLSTSVSKILTESTPNGLKASGVELADGRIIHAQYVVSNATPEVTFEQLMDASTLSEKFQQKLAASHYTVAPLMLYLSTDLALEELGYDSGNYWYSASADPEAFYRNIHDPKVLTQESYPGVFLGITSLKDPATFKNNQHVIEVVSFIDYQLFEPWKDSQFQHRPDDYYALKEHLKRSLLNAADNIIPSLSDHIISCEVSTPLSNEYYVRATRGSSYGTEKTLNNLGPKGYQNKTEVENLWLCGASTIAHGISGATGSGIAAAAYILKCRSKELLKDTGQTLTVIPYDS